MSSLGQLEVIRSDKSFDSEAARPTLPGSNRGGPISKSRNNSPTNSVRDLGDIVDERILETRDAAIRKAASFRSSTTLAALAAAHHAAGEVENAISAASGALDLCVQASEEAGTLLDPVSARLAIEVLLRSGQIDEAIAFVRALPLAGQVRLSVGAMLASVGRIEEAHSIIDGSKVAGHEAVRGFLQVSEDNNHAAISSLRAALRAVPDDADSALNLSIAFWRIGARRKAISAALQATRSAPGRQDIGLHYLELLLAEREFVRFDQEVSSLGKAGVVSSSRLYILQARAILVRGDVDAGVKLLELAGIAAKAEDDRSIFAEIQSNLIRIRAWNGKIDRDIAVSRLQKLHDDYPTSGVVVVSLAQVANRKRHAQALRGALDVLRTNLSEARVAFVEHQIASLEGDNERAAEKAVEWFTLEPEDPNALKAAIVALGIGQERWDEAAEFAQAALQKFPDDRTQLNNAAYVFAMVGKAEEAIELLSPHATGDFVLTATLGLAYLAANRVNEGMKFYREAAIMAEAQNDDSRSLMTAYQALVVHQLGLLDTNDATAVTAMSLPTVDLPDDWRERSEFLRLQSLAVSNSYGWPLTL
jgi:tetratricopeptide (TPR) repeat protein